MSTTGTTIVTPNNVVAPPGTDAPPAMVRPANADQLPAELVHLPQWVNWRWQKRDDDWTKPPIRPNGRDAKSNDPTTWTTFEEVMEVSHRTPNRGVGFVFAKGGGLVGVDLDSCIDAVGNLMSWAVPIMARFDDTYAEVSPSRTGIKIFCRGNLAGLVKDTGTNILYKDGRVESYQHGRFFTVTGIRYGTSPLQLSEHRADLEWLLLDVLRAPKITAPPKADETVKVVPAAPEKLSEEDLAALREKVEAAQQNDAKFAELYLGGACGYRTKEGKPNLSGADMAFANLMAFHLKWNASRIDAVFRMSARMRDKWDEVHYADTGETYGQHTISEALGWATKERERGQKKSDVPPAADGVVDSIEALNRMPIFHAAGVVWQKFTMTQSHVFGYAGEKRIKWDAIADLLSFSKSQAVIARYLRVVIPTPPRARIKMTWEPVAGLILKLATVINSGDDMTVELSDLIPMCFRRALHPVAHSNADVFRFLESIRDWRRDPYSKDEGTDGAAPGPFVFVFDGYVYINAHKLRLWASLPRVANANMRKGDCTSELETLGFQYNRQFTREHDGKRIQMDLWQGPLTVLGDSLQNDDLPGTQARS